MKRDNGILEMRYSEDSYKKTLEEYLKNGNLVVVPCGYTLPQALSASSIKEIYTEDVYLKQIKNSNVKRYIHDGVWYDTKEFKPIEYEKWKQDEIDKTERIGSPDEKPPTKQETERINAVKAGISEMVKKWRVK